MPGRFVGNTNPLITGPKWPQCLDRTPARYEPRNPSASCGLAGKHPPAHTGRALALDGSYPHRLRTLGPLLDVELNSLVFLKRFVAVSLYFCVVDEHICCAAVRSDKTEAFVAVKPQFPVSYLQLLSF